MSEYTPGPWNVWTFGDSSIDLAVGPTEGGVAVCQVVTANGMGINTPSAMETGKANAHLISAAPDLLKALVNFLDYETLGEPGRAYVKEVARAAIAKATVF